MRKQMDLQCMTEEECSRMQDYLSRSILQEDVLDKEDIRYIAGVDLAYWKVNSEEYAVCCIVIIDYKTKEIVERVHTAGVVTFPYIAGYLAFRELPLILETADKLVNKPDIYLFRWVIVSV